MKYYAVKVGKETGIYTSWDKAEKFVKGYAGAKYKSFRTRKDAEQYMNDDDKGSSVPLGKQTALEPEDDYAFINGSYNPDKNIYGYGGFISANGRKYPISGSGCRPGMSGMYNVAGKIEGTIGAARLAMDLGVKRLTILYDYTGIEAWVHGSWKCRKKETAEYREAMQDIISKGLAIKFVKIDSHSKIMGSEFADSLAKKAVDMGA